MEIEEIIEGLEEINLAYARTREPEFESRMIKKLKEQKSLILKISERLFIEELSHDDLTKIRGSFGRRDDPFSGYPGNLRGFPSNGVELEIEKEVEELKLNLIEILDKEIKSRISKIEKAIENVGVKESWEKIEELDLYRLKVDGGWLVKCIDSDGLSMTFYPDPSHKWLSSSKSLKKLREELRDLRW